MMNLSQGEIQKEYTIKDIMIDDEELKDFLFTLGCYSGEKITIISKKSRNFVVSIKDARYNIDNEIAELILI
ncbi:MAG: FeoA family protein [Erysipelotrichaceae bacterium]|nr:FeoA family protein [Erysipelotrichaceae bacterium]